MTNKHFVLTYEAVPDMLERRAPFRDEHLGLLKQLQADGHLVLAGALKDGAPGSMFIFKTPTDEVVRNFVANDPYVKADLILNWTIREWVTVIGEGAVNPA